MLYEMIHVKCLNGACVSPESQLSDDKAVTGEGLICTEPLEGHWQKIVN